MFITRLEKSSILERLSNLEKAILRLSPSAPIVQEKRPRGRPRSNNPKRVLTEAEKAKRKEYLKAWRAKRAAKLQVPE